MMMEFMNSQSKSLGPYWPQPGRSILESLLADIPFPFEIQGDQSSTAPWDEKSATRIAHKLERTGIPDLAWARGEAEEETFRMEVRDFFDEWLPDEWACLSELFFLILKFAFLQQVMTFETLNGYFHTSSASNRYFKAHPELKKEKPDMIDRHSTRLRQTVLQDRAKGLGNKEGLDDDHVRVAWPLGLMMIRKN